ncbi:MAG: transposase [Thermoleophilaceae bacterium]|nr:transposase [Thermoleophilaceae bacterium]
MGADRGRPLPPRARRHTALDWVRRERQHEHGRRRKPKGARRSGKSASWRQDLYRARHRLLKARERLTERERRRLIALFERQPVIAEAWALKEAFRSIYRASDRREAERRLDRFFAAVEHAQLPAFTAVADGVRLWRAELVAYFDEPTTNGYAEGVINKVKVIKRRANGLPSFDGFRERVLLASA